MCLGASGSVRARQDAVVGACACIDVHTFWPLNFQPPSTLVGLRASARRGRSLRPARRRAGTRRCPRAVWRDELGLLLFVAVRDQRRDDPVADDHVVRLDLRGRAVPRRSTSWLTASAACPTGREVRCGVAVFRRGTSSARRLRVRAAATASSARTSARIASASGGNSI